RDRRTLVAHDAGDRALTPLRVGYADDRRLLHLGHRNDLVLELDGADPLAARLHKVLRAVDEEDVSLRIDRRDVAGLQPTVGGERLVVPVVAVVAGRDPRAALLQLAAARAVPGQLVTGVGVGHPELNAEQRQP